MELLPDEIMESPVTESVEVPQAELTVEIGGKVFKLIKTGRAQAEQLHHLGKWLATHGQAVSKMLVEKPQADEKDPFSGIIFLGSLLSALSTEAMLELYQIVIGCDAAFADDNFDIVVLVETAQAVYQGHPMIRRLLDRFFSMPNSNTEPEEVSMPSEQPTDGQTMKS